MGQKLREDKIGTLSHNAGVIGLTNSYLTIGGQQYSTGALSRTIATDVTMTAFSRYQIYAVLVSGAVQLRISSNENSTGPVGFNSWKLVGSFMANGLLSVGFGSFITIEGTPTTLQTVGFVPTGSWTTNVGYSGKIKRIGELVIADFYVQLSGAPDNVSMAFNIPTQIAMDTTKVAFAAPPAAYPNVAISGAADSGSVSYQLQGIMTSFTSVLMTYQSNNLGRQDAFANTLPFVWGSGDSISMTMLPYAVTGWSSTPLKDL